MLNDDQPIMTDEELATALAEATALGLVEWEGNDDLRLTNKGIDRALEIREKVGDTNWLILTLLHERIRGLVSEE